MAKHSPVDADQRDPLAAEALPGSEAVVGAKAIAADTRRFPAGQEARTGQREARARTQVGLPLATSRARLLASVTKRRPIGGSPDDSVWSDLQSSRCSKLATAAVSTIRNQQATHDRYAHEGAP